MTTASSRVPLYNYIPLAEDGGPIVPLGDKFLHDTGHFYVQDSLISAGGTRHSQITKWNRDDPRNPPCFHKEVLSRIQIVHNAVLRAASQSCNRYLDPADVTFQLLDETHTRIFIRTRDEGTEEINGNDSLLVEGEGDFIEETGLKTVHAAMRYLADHVLSQQTASPGVISPRRLDAARATPSRTPPLSQPKPERNESESEKEEAGSTSESESSRRSSFSNSTRSSSSVATQGSARDTEEETPPIAYSVTQEKIADQLDSFPVKWERIFDGRRPKDRPREKIAFRQFRRAGTLNPAVRTAFENVVRNPESKGKKEKKIRRMLEQWYEAGYNWYIREKEPEDGPYQGFVKKNQVLLEENGCTTEKARKAVYMRLHSFVEWYYQLDLGTLDGKALRAHILGDISPYDLS